MDIPDEILLDFWGWIRQYVGVPVAFSFVLFLVHLLAWERCRKFYLACLWLASQLWRGVVLVIGGVASGCVKLRERWRFWRDVRAFNKRYPHLRKEILNEAKPRLLWMIPAAREAEKRKESK